MQNISFKAIISSILTLVIGRKIIKTKTTFLKVECSCSNNGFFITIIVSNFI